MTGVRTGLPTREGRSPRLPVTEAPGARAWGQHPSPATPCGVPEVGAAEPPGQQKGEEPSTPSGLGRPGGGGVTSGPRRPPGASRGGRRAPGSGASPSDHVTSPGGVFLRRPQHMVMVP